MLNKFSNCILIVVSLLVSLKASASPVCNHSFSSGLYTNKLVFASAVKAENCPTTIGFEPIDGAAVAKLMIWTLIRVMKDGTCNYAFPHAKHPMQIDCVGFSQ